MSSMNRYRLGDEVPITVQCRNVNGVPANPDAAPTLQIYAVLFGGSDRVETLRMPPKNRHAAVGLFESMVRLGDLYADPDFAADYSWRASWTCSGVAGVAHGVFHIVPSGDDEGVVEAAEFIDKRGSTHLLQQLSLQPFFSEQYVFGDNPRL
jgi:hypothetical protein